MVQKEKECIKILNLIDSGKYPYPYNCKKFTGNTITLFCLLNYGLFHNQGFSYVSEDNELITILKEEYL